MTATPTPGPWIAEDFTHAPFSRWIIAARSGEIIIADGVGQEANARLIVTAVNHHAALVAALRDLITMSAPFLDGRSQVLDRARALLAEIGKGT